jgi:hypothetical protein
LLVLFGPHTTTTYFEYLNQIAASREPGSLFLFWIAVVTLVGFLVISVRRLSLSTFLGGE